MGHLMTENRNGLIVDARVRRRKATRREALERAPRRSGVVGDPGMCRRSLSGNREIPCLTLARISARARVGKVRSRSRQ
jgi:hypothetical protein